MVARACHLRIAAFLAFSLTVTWVEAQVVHLPSVAPPNEPYPGRLVSHPDSSIRVSEPIVDLADPEKPVRPPGGRDGIFQKLLFDATWLAPGGANGFGLTDLTLETVLGLPFPSQESPLIVTPGFVAYYLDGPAGVDLPPRVYEATVQFRWWKRVTPRLGVDLAVTPGLFSDFEQSNDKALRFPGHAVGVFDWTETLKLAFGVSYLDRDDVGILPLGGVIWIPYEHVKLELTAPRPRIARRLYWRGAYTDDVQDWAYVAGEFGGGSWAIERSTGAGDVFTYRDFRLILGVERRVVDGLDARLELGYVFGRKIEFASDASSVEPTDTVMLRAGLTY
ncbi:MAG: hypothetical protein ACYTG0_20060 [Planctomycetota bacterium]|jgi:hypothetical protein